MIVFHRSSGCFDLLKLLFFDMVSVDLLLIHTMSLITNVLQISEHLCSSTKLFLFAFSCLSFFVLLNYLMQPGIIYMFPGFK